MSGNDETTFMFKVSAGAKRIRAAFGLDDEADMEYYHVITTWSQPPKLEATPDEISLLSCEMTVADGPQWWTSTVQLAKLISDRPKGVTAELHARLSLCALTGQPDPIDACEPFMEVKLSRSEASLMFREKGNALKISLDTPESRIVLNSLHADTTAGRSKWKASLDFVMEERNNLKNHILQAETQISSMNSEKSRLEELLKDMEINRATEEASMYTQFKDVLNKKKKKIYQLTRQMERLQAAKAAGAGMREPSPAGNGEEVDIENSEGDNASRQTEKMKGTKRKRATTSPASILVAEQRKKSTSKGRRRKVSSQRDSSESASEFELQKSDDQEEEEEEDLADLAHNDNGTTLRYPSGRSIPSISESAASPPPTTDDEPIEESRPGSPRNRPEISGIETIPPISKSLSNVASSTLFSVTAASLEPRSRDERAPVIKRRRKENAPK